MSKRNLPLVFFQKMNKKRDGILHKKYRISTISACFEVKDIYYCVFAKKRQGNLYRKL